MPSRSRCFRAAAAACLIACLADINAHAYEVEAPRGIRVDITFTDAKSGKPQTAQAILLFQNFPVLIDGKTPKSFGIKDLVPKKPGDIWLRRDPKARGTAPTFIFHEYRGEHRVTLPYPNLPIVLSDAGQLDESIEAGIGDAEAPDYETFNKLQEAIDEDASKDASTPSAKPDPDAPVKIALGQRTPMRVLPIDQLQEIVFNLPDDYQREKPRGRFVQYNKAATGSEGVVQVEAATWFGGQADDEHFVAGGFLPDGAILAVGTFHDLSFLQDAKPRLLGTDPPADAFQPEPQPEQTEAKGRRKKTPPHPRRTPVLVHYTNDLRSIETVTRLPWASGDVRQALIGKDGAVYLTGNTGDNFTAAEKAAKRVETVENPEHLEWARSKNRDPRGDSYVARIAPDRRSIDWIVRFKHAGLYIGLHPDGRVLVERDRGLHYIGSTGQVQDGPKYDAPVSMSRRTPTEVNPKDGSIYFGGDYHSGTGREPYRNPYLYRFNDRGQIQWTAYDWTGPVVGVDQLRLVSDSAIKGIRFDHNGDLIIKGWSDGGNSVLTRQPYDLREGVRTYGFAGTIWGAGVLSVPYLVRMNAETMYVTSYCRWLSYLPLDDLPNGAGISDYLAMANRDIAFTGGSAYGLIETHDAWVTPWWIRYQTNEFARARGGSYLAIFSDDFRKLKFSSVLPGVKGQTLAERGRWLLVVGYAAERHTAYEADIPTITKHAVQPAFGGGERDAYIMLVNTQGQPDPPLIPECTWNQPEKGTKP